MNNKQSEVNQTWRTQLMVQKTILRRPKCKSSAEQSSRNRKEQIQRLVNQKFQHLPIVSDKLEPRAASKKRMSTVGWIVYGKR